MKTLILTIACALSLSGCAVVAVGAAAVSVTSTAVGVAWDVGKAGVSGVAAVGGAAADALSSTPKPSPQATVPTTASVTPAPIPPLTNEAEVRAFKPE
ncbi:hypothetical protein [Iodobacter fluviatilis]|uniref:Lipoprotein n=1 Tax=Iodobacter fluviatilis TaxID=537 RepID=A0A377Q195_9NEIS|nr:hypothetical protein [Iodobacter fluviatilis]TCU90019.1 hypothetical protein EV682_10138 [Iodobacter fluviatilis]STQ89046.1 Uncharacterised protein [Iodobacter fluviatilis]